MVYETNSIMFENDSIFFVDLSRNFAGLFKKKDYSTISYIHLAYSPYIF